MNDEQAILVFMIVKEMHTVFGGASLCIAAKVLIGALCSDSPEYKRMMSFVRLDGDRVCPIASKMERSYSIFIDKHPKWKSKRATTIFDANPKMTPFIGIQAEESYVCTCVACSSLLYYCSFKQEHPTEVEETINAFKMNVSRYVRDEIPGQKIANFTLMDAKGAHLDEELLSLLQSFGTLGDSKGVEWVSTFGSDKEATYWTLKAYLRADRPVVFAMECLPSLADTKRHEYTGTVLGHYHQRIEEGGRTSLPNEATMLSFALASSRAMAADPQC